MRCRPLPLTVVLLFASVMTLASHPAWAEDAPKGVAVTEADSGKAVEVKEGETISVSLPSNPSTGYSWRGVPSDIAILEQVGEAVYAADGPPRPGQGGHVTLHFKAKKAGAAVIKLAYQRPWEKDQAPAETFSLNVTVKAK